ncbi:MAG: undecaprenyldiphospho-muramoylpentapeptide beta-N-acetylglucosaminyltransferase [Hyphomicrobiales bacterium]|nr:undecaprenyldiphospho-muramoylpentapeptide beta-N-acetylglucosaminyltransferase [Hyphomicrobiales bacterium]
MNGAAKPVFVLASGGTGGHVFPAEALAEALIARGARPVLFTDRRGGNFSGALSQVDICRIWSGGIAGLGRWRRVRSLVALGFGCVQALIRLRRVAPKAVVGFGGYASLPTVFAASIGGYRTLVHEQNAVLGRANRMLAGRVDRVATAFAAVERVPESAEEKITRIGMPVRRAFCVERDRPYEPPAHGEPVRLLILGGSQGAQVFSAVIPAAIASLPNDLKARLRITQQCRPENLDAAEALYRQAGINAELASFFSDVPRRLGEAHLLIGRSGASTVAELTALGRPAILIPYPFAIDDHQAANAQALAAAGAAQVIPQSEFSPERLAEVLRAILENPGKLTAMAAVSREMGVPEAGQRLADLVFEVAGEGDSNALRHEGTV